MEVLEEAVRTVQELGFSTVLDLEEHHNGKVIIIYRVELNGKVIGYIGSDLSMCIAGPELTVEEYSKVLELVVRLRKEFGFKLSEDSECRLVKVIMKL